MSLVKPLSPISPSSGSIIEGIRPVIDSFLGHYQLTIKRKGGKTTYFSANINNGVHFQPVSLDINDKELIDLPVHNSEGSASSVHMKNLTDEVLLDTFWLIDTTHHHDYPITEFPNAEIRIGESLRHKFVDGTGSIHSKDCRVHVNFPTSTTMIGSEKSHQDGPKDVMFEFNDRTRVYASLQIKGTVWLEILNECTNAGVNAGSFFEVMLGALLRHDPEATNATCFLRFKKISLSLEFYSKEIGKIDPEQRRIQTQWHKLKKDVFKRIGDIMPSSSSYDDDDDPDVDWETKMMKAINEKKVLTQECYKLIRYLYITDSSGRRSDYFDRVVECFLKIRLKNIFSGWRPGVAYVRTFYTHKHFEQDRREEKAKEKKICQDMEKLLDTTVESLKQSFEEQEKKKVGAIVDVESLPKLQEKGLSTFQLLIKEIESLRREKSRRWERRFLDERMQPWWLEYKEEQRRVLRSQGERIEHDAKEFEQGVEHRRRTIDPGNQEAIVQFEEDLQRERQRIESRRQRHQNRVDELEYILGEGLNEDELEEEYDLKYGERNVRPRLA